MTALINGIEDTRDRSLVRRHQSGDATAFAELYALHYSRLTRFCRRLVRNSHLAEEIAQDAFLRAYVAMDRLEGDRRFYPWLTVIARRLVIDHVRRDGRVQPQPDVNAGHTGAAEEMAFQRLQGVQLHTALDRVRDRHREVLRLRDWEGLSYDAIADRLGLAPTAVPPLLHRARAALRREYLLVSEGRVAALFPVAVLTGALRRARDRMSAWGAWLPDASSVSAPMAGMALSLGTLAVSLSGGHTLPAPSAGDTAASFAPVAAAGDQAAAAPSLPVPAPSTAEGTDGADARRPPDEHLVDGVAAGSVTQGDRDGVRRAREDGHGRPVYVDAGLVGLWLDPQDDRRQLEESVAQAAPSMEAGGNR